MPTIISQCNIYIDAGATPGGSGGSATQVGFSTSLKITDESSVEIVKAIGKRKGAGFREKAGGLMLTFNIHRTDVPEIDFRQYKRDKKYFQVITQDENGGERRKYFPCKVSKVSRTLSAEGEHEDEVEIAALDER